MTTGLSSNSLIKLLHKCLGGGALICLSLVSLAQIPADVDPSRLEQRQQYKEAVRLIQLGRKSEYRKLMLLLEDYPLYTYLQYEEIVRNFATTHKNEIISFVEQYKETPLARELMRDWLVYLGKRGLWYRYSKSYEEAYSTSSLECYKGYSLYRLGQHQAAFEVAEKLWVVGHSQVNECDQLFQAWQQAGQLTPEVAWQRFDKSLDGNNLRLAKYLTRYLSNQDRTQATFYKRVYTNPAIVARYSTFEKDTDENRKLIIKGVGRLARSDTPAALKHFTHYNNTHSFTQNERQAMQLMLGIRLTRQSDNLEQLSSLPSEVTHHPDLLEAILRNRLKHQDWAAVLSYIDLLPEDSRKHPRWQYWKARALFLSDEPTEKDQGLELFRSLSASRTFYGFLSADIIGTPYQFEHVQAELDRSTVHSLEQLPGMQRSLELYALKERTRARREWMYASRNFTDDEHIMAADIATRSGWHKQAIQSMINARAWDDLNTRFPMAFRELFRTNAARSDIPVHWSLAIARQESAFMPDAQSGSGALGVMQLMPATAKATARKLGVRYRSSRQLLDPETNIKLGSAYLSMMLKRFNNNRILASAAYNAGPTRVTRWKDGSLPFDTWIEIIPFKETRQYVQNVLMFSTIYGRHMNEENPLIYQHELSDFGKSHIAQVIPVGRGISDEFPEEIQDL